MNEEVWKRKRKSVLLLTTLFERKMVDTVENSRKSIVAEKWEGKT